MHKADPRIVVEKNSEIISNPHDLIKHYEKTVDADKLNIVTKKLKQSDINTVLQSLEEIRSIESFVVKIYFTTFADLLDQSRWKWIERPQHPARDLVNRIAQLRLCLT